ncbi:MAG: SlyX family protein, partial [Deltaproteobacteria bacterium]|nr:SlyX family protein [Deltaproteobacteria bacterium]
LENKVLYQDRTIDELNEVVTRQQDQIDKLNAEFERLRALLESAAEGGIEDDDVPPPHY